jgi:predicted MFS family arabinose efflux permease
VPPRERARYQGYFLAVFGSSSVLGPLVGGTFAGQESLLGITGWRWVFLINIPIGLIALAIIWRVVHLPHTRRDHKIDYLGAAMLTVGLVPLLLVAEQGRSWGWGSGRSIACIVVGVAGVIAFVLAERRIGDDALLPLRLFKGGTFRTASILNGLIGMAMFGGMACIPLYMQIAKGFSPTEAGLLMIPMMIGMMGGSTGSGQFISRTGRYKIFPVVGSVLLVVGMGFMSTLAVDTPLVLVDTYAFVFGLGLGFNMQTLVIATQNSVPPQDMGVATSSATFFRQMGGTMGTAVFLSVLFSSLPDRIAEAASRNAASVQAALSDPAVLADPANRPGLALFQGGGPSGSASALDDSSFISALDPRLARPILEGFASSIDLVFMIGLGILLVNLVVTMFLPEEPLRNMSGIQARQAEADERAAAGAVADAAAAATPGVPATAVPTVTGAGNGATGNAATADGTPGTASGNGAAAATTSSS